MTKELMLNDEFVEEVYEILCEIPFEKTSMRDTEPSTKRHPGIEQLIVQLQDWIKDSGVES